MLFYLALQGLKFLLADILNRTQFNYVEWSFKPLGSNWGCSAQVLSENTNANNNNHALNKMHLYLCARILHILQLFKCANQVQSAVNADDKCTRQMMGILIIGNLPNTSSNLSSKPAEKNVAKKSGITGL